MFVKILKCLFKNNVIVPFVSSNKICKVVDFEAANRVGRVEGAVAGRLASFCHKY